MEEKFVWLKQFISYIFSRFSRDGCVSIAAELTVTSLLAIVPLLTVMISFLSIFPSMQDLGREFQSWTFSAFIPETGATLEQYLNQYISNTSGLTWIGSLMLFITALMLMKTIDRSFNRIWQVKKQSSQVRVFLVYWAVLTLGPLMIAASLAVSSYFASLPLVSEVVASQPQFCRRLIPFTLAFLAFAVMFIAVPNRKVKLKHSVIAALITALLFETAKWGFGVFVRQFSTYQLIFGAVAAIPLFLIWLQVNWMIILFGAEICHGLDVFRPDAEKRASHSFILAARIMKMAIDAQKNRATLDMPEIRATLPKARADHLENVLDKLIANQLIKEIEANSFTLSGDSDSYRLLDLFNAGFVEIPNEEAIIHLQTQDVELAAKIKSAKQAIEEQLNTPFT